MKNVTITLSNDLIQVLDSLCKDCDLSRYAFTKEALLEKIERHTKTKLENHQKEDSQKNVVPFLENSTNKSARARTLQSYHSNLMKRRLML